MDVWGWGVMGVGVMGGDMGTSVRVWIDGGFGLMM